MFLKVGYFFAVIHLSLVASKIDLMKYDIPLIESEDQLNAVIKEDKLTVAYFYIEDVSHLEEFLIVLSQSYVFLKEREVEVFLFDCEKYEVKEYCRAKYKRSIVTFQSSEKLIELGFENLFDEDALISNILQLRLVDDIPVIVDFEELQQYQQKHKGKSNAIFAYFRAIGSKEHRAFVENAYKYRGKRDIILSTDYAIEKNFRDVEDLPTEKGSVWLMKCATMSARDASLCPSVPMYDGLNFNAIDSFFDFVDKPEVFVSDPSLKTDTPRHVIYVLAEDQSERTVISMIERLKAAFSPSVGIGLVTITEKEKNDAASTYMNSLTSFPATILRFNNDPSFLIGPDNFNEDDVVSYMRVHLHDHTLRMTNKSDTNGNLTIEKSNKKDYEDEALQVEEEMSKEANAVNQAAGMLRFYPTDKSHLTALTDENFRQIFKDTPKLLVLYHLKFDSRSKVLLNTFANVSRLTHSKSIMAHVDCHEWKKVCEAANIIFYPQLYVHVNGRSSRYSGRVDPASLTHAATMLKEDNYFELKSVPDAERFMFGPYLAMEKASRPHLSVLALVNTDMQAKEIKMLSEDLSYMNSFGVAKGEVAKQLATKNQLTVPTCVLFRYNDQHVPSVTYKGESFTKDPLRDFIETNQLPVFSELTEKTYPYLAKGGKQLAILFRSTDTEVKSKEWMVMSKIATDQVLNNEVTCSWIDISNENSTGAQMFRTYNAYVEDPKTPKLGILSHKLGAVYFYNSEQFVYDSVITWMSDVLKNTVSPSYNLVNTTWKPTYRSWDYLKMIDQGIYLNVDDEDEVPSADDDDSSKEVKAEDDDKSQSEMTKPDDDKMADKMADSDKMDDKMADTDKMDDKMADDDKMGDKMIDADKTKDDKRRGRNRGEL